MKKEGKLKIRLIAGLLIYLIMLMVPAGAVMGENVEPRNESNAEMLDIFKTNEDISVPEYLVYKHKYESDDGKIVKWYCSYLAEIDGLRRTDEKKSQEIVVPNEDDVCDIKERHAHLYVNTRNSYMTPFYQEDYSIESKGNRYVKTEFITNIDEDTLKILHDYQVYRVCDNVSTFDNALEFALEKGYKGLALLRPISIEDDKINTSIYIASDNARYYDHEIMNGFIIDPKNNVVVAVLDSAYKEEIYSVKKK